MEARAEHAGSDENQRHRLAEVRRQPDGGPDRLLEHEAPMNKRPILVLLTSSWISMLGAALVTLAGFSWLFVLPLNIRGKGVSNPYIGLLIFIAIPIVFFAGLILIPIGIALAKHQVTRNLDEIENRRTAWR